MTLNNGKFEITVTQQMALRYLLYLPSDYDAQQHYPLMLFLHGAGERGDDLDLVKLHGPPKRIEEGADLPFIIVAPQCPEDHWWYEFNPALMGLIDNIIENYAVDTDRVYLTGLSMGGYGSWYLAYENPDRFAAMIPICGGMRWLVDVHRAAERLKSLPIWTFHGEDDPIVPVSQSELMVAALKEVGSDVKFTTYPGVEHNSWGVTYENPEIYEWLLRHKISDRRS